MTPRQRFALEHPLNEAALRDTSPWQAVRRHATGLLIMSILAVDR